MAAQVSTSFAPPAALCLGSRLAMKLEGRWREGTCLELRDEQRGANLVSVFRVRYNEVLPGGAWTMWHGPSRDEQPVGMRLLEAAAVSADWPSDPPRLSQQYHHDPLELRGGGVVIMRGALDLGEQAALLQNCLVTMSAHAANATLMENRPPPDSVWDFGYDDSVITDFGTKVVVARSRPACLDIAAQLLDRMHCLPRHVLHEADRAESNAELHLCPLLVNLGFNRVWARLYAAPNALGWHRDPDLGIRGWVCLVNLGADATFAWRHQGGTLRQQLVSGDALFINGHVLEHCVEQIHADTCPHFWKQAMGGTKFVRVGLQMRA